MKLLPTGLFRFKTMVVSFVFNCGIMLYKCASRIRNLKSEFLVKNAVSLALLFKGNSIFYYKFGLQIPDS